MSYCLKISVTAEAGCKQQLASYIKQAAHDCAIEGFVQPAPQGDDIYVIACGPREQLDQFLDQIHMRERKQDLVDIAVEPVFKPKDYRGVFRIIE